MKAFVSIDIESALSNDDVYKILSGALPDFLWRQGDSDEQGEYVSGVSSDGVKIQCWSGDTAMAMSVSFRGAKEMDSDARRNLVKIVLNDAVVRIGTAKKVDM